MNEQIDYTYPEGFDEAAELLDFLPEDARKAILSALVGFVQMI